MKNQKTDPRRKRHRPVRGTEVHAVKLEVHLLENLEGKRQKKGRAKGKKWIFDEHINPALSARLIRADISSSAAAGARR